MDEGKKRGQDMYVCMKKKWEKKIEKKEEGGFGRLRSGGDFLQVKQPCGFP